MGKSTAGLVSKEKTSIKFIRFNRLRCVRLLTLEYISVREQALTIFDFETGWSFLDLKFGGHPPDATGSNTF